MTKSKRIVLKYYLLYRIDFDWKNKLEIQDNHSYKIGLAQDQGSYYDKLRVYYVIYEQLV